MARAGPTRPALRYHGGKWRLAPWIISHFPAHRIYVEPFGGAASVLLRDPATAAELIEAVRLTPFARVEFEEAYKPSDDPVERSRRLIVRAFMGFGSDGHNGGTQTGFRANSDRSHTTPALDWRNLPAGLAAIVERLRGVVIEHRAAAEVMAQHDGPETLHYLDPPYLGGTRSPKSRRDGSRYHVYRHEMTDDDHRALAEIGHGLAGMVVLSGYPSTLYDRLFGDWLRVERAALADGAQKRVEVLWLNPAAEAALPQTDLFRVAEAVAPRADVGLLALRRSEGG